MGMKVKIQVFKFTDTPGVLEAEYVGSYITVHAINGFIDIGVIQEDLGIVNHYKYNQDDHFVMTSVSVSEV